MRRLAILVCCLGVSSRSFAEDAPEIRKTVDAFVGHWKLTTSMTTPDGKTTKIAETLDCTKVAMGRAASCIDRSEIPGMGKIEYDFLISWDTESKVVHAFAVGSPGEVHDHRCSWKDAKTLECETYKGTLGGQPLVEDVTFVFDGNNLALKGKTTTKDGSAIFDAAGRRGK